MENKFEVLGTTQCCLGVIVCLNSLCFSNTLYVYTYNIGRHTTLNYFTRARPCVSLRIHILNESNSDETNKEQNTNKTPTRVVST